MCGIKSNAIYSISLQNRGGGGVSLVHFKFVFKKKKEDV